MKLLFLVALAASRCSIVRFLEVKERAGANHITFNVISHLFGDDDVEDASHLT